MTTSQRLIVAGFSALTGSAVGSFVNVCVWRLPRGESLIHPKSRCPRCETAIGVRDNVPVLGWLALRGRCRHCKGPISSRYPIVEASVGILFAIVALIEISGPLDPIDRGLPAFAASLLYHWLLAGLLVTVALIEHDRKPAPESVSEAGTEVVLSSQRLATGFGLLGTFGVLVSFVSTGDGLGTVLNLGLLLVFFRSLRF